MQPSTVRPRSFTSRKTSDYMLMIGVCWSRAILTSSRKACVGISFTVDLLAVSALITHNYVYWYQPSYPSGPSLSDHTGRICLLGPGREGSIWLSSLLSADAFRRSKRVSPCVCCTYRRVSGYNYEDSTGWACPYPAFRSRRVSTKASKSIAYKNSINIGYDKDSR